MARHNTPQMVSLLVNLLIRGSIAAFDNITRIDEAIPQLRGLEPADRSVTPGRQSWNHCCLLAVNASFRIINKNEGNGSLAYSEHPFLDTTTVSPFDFAGYAAAGADSFPCGAKFNGNHTGAPEVRVPYSWCRDSCDGWELSHRGDLTQWIGPLVGFILPCLAFCLNIPRRRKLSIPPWVFSPSPDKMLAFLSYPLRLIIALLFVTVDTIGWLCVCFALAGPMLLSGVYETWIDMRLLRYLWREIIFDAKLDDSHRTNQVLTMKLRAQLLLLVVVGNIDIISTEGQNAFVEILGAVRGLEAEDQSRLENVVHVKSKLLALCSSQNSFGSAVGAPVVFFVGAFIYNMIDVQSRLGDNDTAHALAFGMWWMTIPFLAIISCLLLASNNPGSLHGILAAETRATPTWKLFEGAYVGPYEPVSLWDRGPSKMHWLEKTLEQYDAIIAAPGAAAAPAPAAVAPHPIQHHHYHAGILLNNFHQPQRAVSPSASHNSASTVQRRKGQLAMLRQRMKPLGQDWALIFAAAVIPLATAFILAFITSYTTPRVGLACRSLTHLLYFVTQLIQMTIWMCSSRVALDDDNKPSTRGFRAKQFCLRALKFVFGLIAAFVSIGGTLMQLIGVYRNCLCKVPAWYWLRTGSPEAYVDLGQNSALSILNAELFWVRTAAAATGILCSTCALAWWFQRHLRSRYAGLVGKIEVNPSW